MVIRMFLFIFVRTYLSPKDDDTTTIRICNGGLSTETFRQGSRLLRRNTAHSQLYDTEVGGRTGREDLQQEASTDSPNTCWYDGDRGSWKVITRAKKLKQTVEEERQSLTGDLQMWVVLPTIVTVSHPAILPTIDERTPRNGYSYHGDEDGRDAQSTGEVGALTLASWHR